MSLSQPGVSMMSGYWNSYGRVMTPDYVIDEMQRNGETFRRKKLYRVMMLVLFLQSTGILA